MQGLMQDHPLLISSLLTHAARNCRDGGIVTAERSGDGAATGRALTVTYPELAARTARLAHTLTRLGVETGDRIATLAWNDQRHYELYFAISGIGAVCHTINPRLFPDQITYIIRHAQDRWIFVDPTLLPVLEGIAPQIRGLPAGIVVMRPTSPKQRSPKSSTFTPTTTSWPAIPKRSTGRSSRKPPQPASATPQGQRATQRASSTRTARPSSMPGRSRCPAPFRCVPAKSSCRSSRCSMSTPGAASMPPP